MSKTLKIMVLVLLAIVVLLFVAKWLLPSNPVIPNQINPQANQPVVENNNKVDDNSKFITAFDSNNFAEANAVVDTKLTANPKDIEALIMKATTLAQQGSIEFKEKELGDQARAYALKALELDPRNVRALEIIGYTYEIQQDYVNAHKYYDMALAIDPNDVITLTQKGHAYYMTGEVSKSETFYKKALGLKPDITAALAGIGKVLTAQGKDKEAKEIFVKIAALAQNSREKSEAYYSAAVLGSNIKGYNPSEIEGFVEKALSADPTFAMPYIKKSEILLDKAVLAKDKETKLSLTSEAFASVEKSIELNKNQAMAHFQLMQNFYQVGQIKEAKIVLKNLPSIIERDITLSKTEKDDLKKILIGLQDKIK
jgi:tetratricopeptide (TPR) repeat protein